MTTQINDLLQKEMSRKEFLAITGFGIASIFGFGTILRLLGVDSRHNQALHGYGSSSYGGKQ